MLAFESIPTPYGWKRRKRAWPVPGVADGPAKSTLNAGVPAGTLKKKLVVWFRPIVPDFVTV